ncbi:MAG: type I methionyl aminopeptidase [Candidatus Omnitrophota bacterium]|nr:MAG: type I methionyl aminopeptidase [Candidatus Omnitrophota bacterium]
MIPIKSEEEIKILAEAGEILARMMEEIKQSVKPRIKTLVLERLAEELAQKESVGLAFKGYKGFPAGICISVNDEIVHGIPGERIINEGDIVSLDLGVRYKGFYSDMAVTVAAGKIDPATKKLIQVTKEALDIGIKQAQPNNRVFDISCAIQKHVEKNGFSVVRQFVGHGIGTNLHEEPEVPNFGLAHQGETLRTGMVIAIEPMANMGSWECEILNNGWTAVTKDRCVSAHFEHTIAITEKGPKILTQHQAKVLSY